MYFVEQPDHIVTVNKYSFKSCTCYIISGIHTFDTDLDITLSWCDSTIIFITEPITIEIYLVNPLKVALTLTDVTLLWSFLPTIASHDKPQLITNEHMVTAKVSHFNTTLIANCSWYSAFI